MCNIINLHPLLQAHDGASEYPQDPQQHAIESDDVISRDLHGQPRDDPQVAGCQKLYMMDLLDVQRYGMEVSLCNAVLCYVVHCHATLCCAVAFMLLYAALCCVLLCSWHSLIHDDARCAVLCHATLCCALLCFALYSAFIGTT